MKKNLNIITTVLFLFINISFGFTQNAPLEFRAQRFEDDRYLALIKVTNVNTQERADLLKQLLENENVTVEKMSFQRSFGFLLISSKDKLKAEILRQRILVKGFDFDQEVVYSIQDQRKKDQLLKQKN